jgi:hypothetical protein
MSLAHINRPETLKALFPGDSLGGLTRGVFGAVDRSFRDSEGRMKKDITQVEIKDRFTACVEWAKTLRGDFKWGLERIVGQFDEIIRCHLAKMDYKPPTRQLWMPGDGG